MRFNIRRKRNTPTVNYEGVKAFRPGVELELYSAVVTASLSDTFYESATERLQRVRMLIAKNDPAYVAKLAVYVREKMYLRSMPLVLIVELAKQHSGDGLVSRTVTRVIQRADEIPELLSCYIIANNRQGVKKLACISKQVRKGLAMAFHKFDEYQFAKYNRDTAVTLKDALFLVHAKAKDETQQVLFRKIRENTLGIAYTWETALSAIGARSFATREDRKLAFRQTWEELIDNNRLGYMAMLRNLRNLLNNDVSAAHIQKVYDRLTDKTAILYSKQLPFRFLSAYRQLKNVKDGLTGFLLQALENALKTSVEHLQGFGINARVVVACDVSGSMQRPVSAKSTIMLYDIGLLLGMLLRHKCKNVVSGMFGDTWKIIPVPADNILASVDEFYRREGEVGYATNGHLVLEDLVQRQYIADKIMLFTDGQLWNSAYPSSQHNTMNALWKSYKEIAPQAKLYLFDLAGYKTVPLDVREDDVYLVAGWSDKIFDVIEAIDRGADAVSHIQGIEL